LHEIAYFRVNLFVNLPFRAAVTVTACCMFSAMAVAASAKPRPVHDPKLDFVLHAVEQRYNSAHSLRLKFTESYEAGARVRQTESGILELRKPGRMRWDYNSPAGKMFLSDGKHFYLYTPGTARVEVTSVRDTEDMHAPLAFLLGKLNFYKEFLGFDLHGEGPDKWISAEPTNAALPYSKVEFLVTPDSRIRRLRVTEDDLSVLDFQFEDEQLNAPIDASRFVFHAPPGAEIDDSNR
jgi:outer membrane lipoprotein carrier protein